MGARRRRWEVFHFHIAESNAEERGNHTDFEKLTEEVGEKQGEGPGPHCAGEGHMGP